MSNLWFLAKKYHKTLVDMFLCQKMQHHEINLRNLQQKDLQNTCVPSEWTCGRPAVAASSRCPRVVGGCVVAPNSWAFMAMHVLSMWNTYKNTMDMLNFLTCGAALVSETCVVTAAHCKVFE